MSEISIHEGEGQAILALCGAIDAAHVTELLAAAVAACGSGKPVVLDWSRAEHLHAGALQVLLALNTELATQGRPLQIPAFSPAVRDCIAAAGLVQSFNRNF